MPPRITKSGKVDGRSKSSAQNGKKASILVKKALQQVKQKNVEFHINSDDDTDSESELEAEPEPEPELEQEQEQEVKVIHEPKPTKKELIDYEKLLKEREQEWDNKEQEFGGKLKQKETEFERLLKEKEQEIKEAKLGFIKQQRHRMSIKF